MRKTLILALLLALMAHEGVSFAKPHSRKSAIPRAPSSTPGLPDDFIDEEEEDEEDVEDANMGRPPVMPTPFNTVNPNAIGGANRPDPNYSPNRPTMGSPMTAGPAKFKFKVVEGEYYEKGKKRGRARDGTPAFQGKGSSSSEENRDTPPE